MSNVPNELKYTKTHEWVRVESDGSGGGRRQSRRSRHAQTVRIPPARQ